MAFQVPALIALLFDALIVYINSENYNDGYSGFKLFMRNLYHFEGKSLLLSDELLNILAYTRLVFIIPYIWFYSNNSPILWPIIPKSWLYLNVLLLLLRLIIIYVSASDRNADLYAVVLISLLSCIFHFICLEHLKSTAPSSKLAFYFSVNSIDKDHQNKLPLSATYNSPVQLKISDKFGKIDQSNLNSLMKPNLNLTLDFNDIESQNASTDTSPSKFSKGPAPIPRRLRSDDGDGDDVSRRLSDATRADAVNEWDLDSAFELRRCTKGNNNNKNNSSSNNNNNSNNNSKTNKNSGNNSDAKQQPLFNLIIDLFTDKNLHLYDLQSHSKENQDQYNNYVAQICQRIDLEITLESISEVKFFIAQLSIHLMHGQDLNIALNLQKSFLTLCRESITVSHRWYWFLNAFYLTENSPSSTFTAETRRVIQNILQEIAFNGEIAAKNALLVSNNSQSHDASSESDLSPLLDKNKIGNSRSPLQFKKGSFGEFDNNDCRFSLSPLTNVYDRVTSHFDVNSESSLDLDVVDSSRNANVASFSSPPLKVLHQNLVDIFPAEVVDSQKSNGETSSSSSAYHTNLFFWNTLCEMSKKVALVPKLGRNEYLRTYIKEVSKGLFPSPHLYAPLGSDQHRIVSIISDESFAFSTASRAPVFVCLEIVDYGSRKTRKPQSSWWGGIRNKLRESLGAIGLPGLKAVSRNQSPVRSPWRQAGGMLGSNSVSPISRPIKTSTYGSVEGHPGSSSSKISPLFINYNTNSSNNNNNNNNNNNSNSNSDSNNSSEPESPVKTLLSDSPLLIDVSSSSNFIASIAEKSPDNSASSMTTSTLFTPPRYLNVGNSPKNGCNLTPTLTTTALCSNLNSAESSSVRSLLHSNLGDDTDSSEIDNSSVGNSSNPEKEVTKPIIVFQEQWKHKEERIRKRSPIGHLPGWRLLPVIIKTMDDLRQEQIISQSVAFMHHILLAAHIDCWLRPYDIIALSSDCGLIEAVPNTLSLDALKKSYPEYHTLSDFFAANFSPIEVSTINAINLQTESLHSSNNNNNNNNNDNSDSNRWDQPSTEIEPASFGTTIEQAKENFTKSLATYCIICYILQLKDRHNGNILIDSEGHIIHIDFGFVLGLTPGKNLGFETAPFKLTAEMVDVMGGCKSRLFYLFRDVCVKVFMELRRQCHRIILALEIFARCHDHLPCFSHNKLASGSQKIIADLRSRFHLHLHDHGAVLKVHELIDLSLDNWTTTCYDHFQRSFNGIF